MTKRLKLYAGAVVAALCLPGAALAEVALYGKAHLSLESQDDGTNTGTGLSSNASRLGVKGSTDLSTGLTGFFQYEIGTNVDETNQPGGFFQNPAGSGTGRDSFLGLKGGWGAIKAGRLSEGGANAWVYDANLFADQLGDIANLTSAGAPFARGDNSVNYVTPDWGGFGIGVTYIPEDSTAPNTSGSTGVSLRYATKALAFGVHAYNFDKSTVAGANDPKVTAVSGTYDWGGGVLTAMFVSDKDEGGVSGADRNIVTLGAGFKVGSAGMFKVQYADADERDNAPNTGAKLWAAGYDHAIAKNATLYVVYASVDNDSAASFHPFNYGHGENFGTVTAGSDPSGLGVGFIYNFGTTWQ